VEERAAGLIPGMPNDTLRGTFPCDFPGLASRGQVEGIERIIGMRLRLTLAVLAALMLALGACGGGSSNYMLPTDSKVKPFKAPATEDLAGGDEDEWNIEGDDDDDSAGATGDEGAAAGGDEGGVEGGVAGGTAGGEETK